MLQSENEMGNWSDKSAITNGVANLKLNFKQKLECSAKWCCKSLKKIMELSDYQQWIVINQIEAENEKTKITHVNKIIKMILQTLKMKLNRHYKLDGPNGTVIKQESCNWHCNSDLQWCCKLEH